MRQAVKKLVLVLIFSNFLVGCKDPLTYLIGPTKTAVDLGVAADLVTGRYNPLPTSVDFTFPALVKMSSVSADDFIVQDTCAGTSVSLDSVSSTGQVTTVTLQNTASCVNTETVVVKLNYKSLELTDEEKKGAGTLTVTYTFDNAAPAVSAALGAVTGIVASGDYIFAAAPTSATFTFSSDIDLTSIDPSDFAVSSGSGTDCPTLPSIGTVTTDSSASTATVNLTGAVCNDGEGFKLTLAQDAVSDQTLDGATGADAPHTAPPADLEIGVDVLNSTPAVVSVGDGATTADGTYAAGASLDFVVTFDVAVDVSGVPRLQLDLPGSRYATYSSGTGTTELVFSYTVATGETTADLDYLATTSLGLNGGSISRAGSSGGLPADLDLPSPGGANSLSALRDLVLDGVAPALVSSVPSGASDTWGTSARDITFTFSEGLEASSLADTDLTITAGTCSSPPTVTASALSGGSSETVTFSLSSSTCADTEDYVLTFAPADVTDAAGNVATGGTRVITVTTDTTAPAIVVGAPSVAAVNSSGTVTYTVTYSNAASVTLADGDVQFAGASTDCAATVSGSGVVTRTIDITGCSDDGDVQISIDAGTATTAFSVSAAAVAEGDITDFAADQQALPTPTLALPVVGANALYSLPDLTNFTLTFTGDHLGLAASVQSALALNCDTGGGANAVSFTLARTSDTVATLTPNEASPDFVYGASCSVSGVNVPDWAGNTSSFSGVDFKVSAPLSGVSGPSGTVSVSSATTAGDLGDAVFNVALDAATVDSTNVTMECDALPVALTSLTLSSGDKNVTLDFDEADANWTALVGGETCAVTFSTAVTNSLGEALTTPVVFSFTTSP